MLVHGFASSLEELGLEQLPTEALTKYKALEESLVKATELLGRSLRLCRRQYSVLDMLALEAGIFGAYCWHFDAEDILEVDSNYVRNHHRDGNGVEGIEHYVLFNQDTNVGFLSPEVVFMRPEEKANPQLFLDRLREPPYQLVFDTSTLSHQTIRQFYIKTNHPGAQMSNYNTMRDLQRVLDPSADIGLVPAQRPSAAVQQDAARSFAFVETPHDPLSLVDRHIFVWWSGDELWYRAYVRSYSATRGHGLRYEEDDSTDMVHLSRFTHCMDDEWPWQFADGVRAPPSRPCTSNKRAATLRPEDVPLLAPHQLQKRKQPRLARDLPPLAEAADTAAGAVFDADIADDEMVQ